MIPKAEILAPAGNMECVSAAVRSGADAIYLGVGSFNARRNADNFTFEELEEVVRYCHERDVRVHLALNTLVCDDEFEDALLTAKKAALCGVDAFIVQDLGLASAIRKMMPSAVLHASTQTSVQTKYGIDFLRKNGFSRVVLPREMSEKEILGIIDNCETELEVFVHGALCMCVSGQCYLSSMIGGRSGNRGLCAQPCRLPFSADSSERYDLSLKDNSLIDHIAKMAKSGVDSFKIEGRMKRPEYVAGAVKACRNALEGKQDDVLRKNLKYVFSRSGFTDGYFTGKRGREMFGIRQRSDSENASSSIKELKKLYEKETPKFGISFDVTIKKGELPFVRAVSRGREITVFGEEKTQEAQSKPTNAHDVKKQFQKLGATPFYLDDFVCHADENVFVSASALNCLRRKAVDEIVKLAVETEEIVFNDISFEKTERRFAESQKTYYVFRSAQQIPDCLNDSEVFLPIFCDNGVFEKYKNSGAVMPAGIMHNADRIRERMSELERIGVKKAICPTVDTLAIAREFSFKIIMGFNSNVCNTQSLEFFKNNGADECVVSVELTKNRINSLGGDVPEGIVAYGKIPLMLTRNCPIRNVKTCEQCKGESYLTDRKGEKFEVVCANGFSEVLNPYPIYIFDKKDDFKNVDFFLLNFTTESREQVEETIKRFNDKIPPEDKFTRGLYYRKAE